VLGQSFQTFPGGKGANQAIACARSGGVPTAMLLALGHDSFAQPLEDSLSAAGVQMHIRRSTEPTGTAFICVDDAGENAITVAPGANGTLGASDLPALDGVSHLVMQLEIPVGTVTAYAQAARARRVQVVLNAAPAQALPADLLDHVDVLIVNEGELATVSGQAVDAQDAASIDAALARLGVPQVIVTLGGAGAVARWDGRTVRQGAYAIDPVDTTAAGDSFVGAFVAAIAQGISIRTALQQANAAGALACLKAGAQSSIPTRADVLAFASR
jgi:ribokinase